jgi:hypothetical protein
MRQLVRQQLLACGRARLEGALAKEDVVACGEGERTHTAVKRIGISVSVNTNAGEAGAKCAFHTPLDYFTERTARTLLRSDTRRECVVERPTFRSNWQWCHAGSIIAGGLCGTLNKTPLRLARLP